MNDELDLIDQTVTYEQTVQGSERRREKVTLHFTEKGMMRIIDRLLGDPPTSPNTRTRMQSILKKNAKKVETTEIYPDRP